MKYHHTPSHWILVALVIAAALFTFTHAWGQTTPGAGAVFEGRPAMAGAQAGQGAMAGPPQGGLGVQGSEGQKGLNLRKPTGLDDMPALPKADPVAAANTDMTIKPAKDSLAKDQRSAVKKSKRAVKRTVTRARHGVSEIDGYTKAGS